MTRALRIAVLTNGYAPRLGGIERQLGLILPLLACRGHEVLVITRRDPGTPATETIDGVAVRRVSAPPTKAGAAFSYLGGALRYLRRFRPDVVQANELFSCATAGVLFKAISNTALVVTPHSRDLDRLLAKPFGMVRLRAIRRATDAFTIISEEHDAELAEVGVSESKRRRVANGVDTDHFRPPTVGEIAAAREHLGVGPSAPVGTYCGRIDAIKRVDRLVDAWATVRSAHPEARLFIVGDGTERMRLQGRLAPGCTFVGRVDDVRPFLRAADVYVQLSDVEGFSNSIVEAQAMGLPVVTTEVGGARQLIGRHRTGDVVGPSAEAAARALISLFDSPARRAEYGERARTVVVGEMSGDRVVDDWERLFEDLCDLPARRAA